jgi:hypothetical protein
MTRSCTAAQVALEPLEITGEAMEGIGVPGRCHEHNALCYSYKGNGAQWENC